jgi:hypothetical protein
MLRITLFQSSYDFQAGNPKIKEDERNFELLSSTIFLLYHLPCFYIFTFFPLSFSSYSFLILITSSSSVSYQSCFIFWRPQINILARRPAVMSGVVVVFLRLSVKSLNSTGNQTKTGSFNIC